MSREHRVFPLQMSGYGDDMCQRGKNDYTQKLINNLKFGLVIWVWNGVMDPRFLVQIFAEANVLYY